MFNINLHSLKKGFLREFGSRGKFIRDWKILLVFFLILNTLVALASFYLFHQTSSKNLLLREGENAVPVQTINRSSLTSTLEEIEFKAQTFEELKENAPLIANPR